MNAEVQGLVPVARFTPPPLHTVKAANALARGYFKPQFTGLENVNPINPALLVGNHTIYGMLDGPLLFEKLYESKGIVLRSLGDHMHFKVPLWRDVLKQSGAVPGTRENCARLMEAGEHILVYPGGGREVAKRKGEKYKLTWKTRTGFCYMAIKHQYPIIPVASLGADDAFDVVLDAYDFMRTPVARRILKSKLISNQTANGDLLMPLAKGIGPTLIPRPEKFYFSFGEPIDTRPYAGQENNKERLWQLRYQVMQSLERELEKLRVMRAGDSDVGLWRKLLTKRK